jgi:phospholipase D1/2
LHSDESVVVTEASARPEGRPPLDARRTQRALTLLLPVIPLLAAVAVWYFADLGRLDSPEKVAEAARSLREDPLAFVYVLLAFAVGTLLFFPVTALMLGTTLAFEPLQGFTYAYAGALLGAAVTYWTGRLAGGAALDAISGPRLRRFRHELCTHAFRASVIARFLPVGNFSVINMLSGSLRIPFSSFAFGNMVGIAPGVLMFTLFSDQIAAALRSPSKKNVTIVVVALLVVAVVGVLLKRWIKRREAADEGGAP